MSNLENIPRRIYINEDLRNNSEKFLVDPKVLPKPFVSIPELPEYGVHTFYNIVNRERKLLNLPSSEYSLNVAQFIAVISSITSGVGLELSKTGFPEHLRYFEDAFDRNKELSILTFDMDNLTVVNTQYSHLHGSIVCSMLEREILEIVEGFGGLLASMGEENLVALPLSLEDSYQIADYIRQRFSSIPFDFGAGEFHQGVSVGVASLTYSKPSTFRRIMELSGGALVYTKKHGKGFVTMFGD